MDLSLVEHVAAQVAAHGLLAPGEPVLAMVSGGADSMCLLDLLTRVHDGPPTVLTIDHGLRPDSADECAAVAADAERRGLPVVTRRLELTPGAGLQERARQARRAVALEVADARGIGTIATGHTRSDQAETVLFRLARGTGRTGAAGMRARAGRFVRPLLDVSRDDTREWCRTQGIVFVDDPSNDDPSFARVRVRHQLMPVLEHIHPGAERAVARYAELAADEADLLDQLAAEAWTRCATARGLDVAALRGEHHALTRLLVRRLLHDHGLPADGAVVARVVELAGRERGSMDVAGGAVRVDAGVLHVSGPAAPTPAATVVRVPGTTTFGRHRLHARRDTAVAPTATSVSVRPDARLAVRSPEAGDRIALAGGGHARVGKLLAAAGVASHVRHLVPVVVDDGRVVWVGGYRADPELLVAPGEPAIRLELV